MNSGTGGLFRSGILISFRGPLLSPISRPPCFTLSVFFTTWFPRKSLTALGFGYMLFFMRSLAVSRLGSLLGAIVFSFNGYFMGHLYAGHLSFIQNYIWIPVVFLFLHRFTLSRRFTAPVAAGLFLGIQILGGFPQIAFYTLLASILFILYKTASGWSRQSGSEMVKLGSGLVLCLLLGFCLSAVQVLPTLEYSRLSTRGRPAATVSAR